MTGFKLYHAELGRLARLSFFVKYKYYAFFLR